LFEAAKIAFFLLQANFFNFYQIKIFFNKGRYLNKNKYKFTAGKQTYFFNPKFNYL